MTIAITVAISMLLRYTDNCVFVLHQDMFLIIILCFVSIHCWQSTNHITFFILLLTTMDDRILRQVYINFTIKQLY